MSYPQVASFDGRQRIGRPRCGGATPTRGPVIEAGVKEGVWRMVSVDAAVAAPRNGRVFREHGVEQDNLRSRRHGGLTGGRTMV